MKLVKKASVGTRDRRYSAINQTYSKLGFIAFYYVARCELIRVSNIGRGK